MMANGLRYPYINGKTEKEQLIQIKNYLFQLVEELEFAFRTIETPSATITQVIQTGTRQPSTENIDAEEWINLGLSSGVSDTDISVGRCGTGCYYRVFASKKHIYVAFNCTFTYNGSPIQVNSVPIPSEYRPKRNIYTYCATSGRGFARILVNDLGNIFVMSLEPDSTISSEAVKWIDGYIDYWV